jgi:hypothetical protein
LRARGRNPLGEVIHNPVGSLLLHRFQRVACQESKNFCSCSPACLDSCGGVFYHKAYSRVSHHDGKQRDTYILLHRRQPSLLLLSMGRGWVPSSIRTTLSIWQGAAHFGFPFCTSWAATKTLGLGIPIRLSACEAYSRVAEWKVSLRRSIAR